MKKFNVVSLIVLFIAVVIMGVNLFIKPLSNVLVRIDGIVMIVGIATVSYCSVKTYKEKN